MPDIAALVTPPLLLDSTGAPANGDIYARLTTSVAITGGIATPTQGHGAIIAGQIRALDLTAFNLPVTPEGVAVELFVELREERPEGRKKHVIRRTVSVPDQATVTWDELVDVVPVNPDTDYAVPAWVTELLTEAAAAAAPAIAARDAAIDAQVAAEAAAASVPTEAELSATIGAAVAPKLDTATAATTYAPIKSAILGARAVFAGDSITAGNEGGTVDQFGHSYPNMVSVLSKQRISKLFNAGRPGWKVDQILSTFDTDVAAYAPSLVVLMIGTNDATAGTTVANYILGVKAYGAKIRAIGAKPVICTIMPNITTTPRRSLTVQYNAFLRRYCAEQGIDMVDMYKRFVDPVTGGFQAALTSDGTHPKNGTNLLMAQLFNDTILPKVAAVEPTLAMENADPNNLVANGLHLGSTSGTAGPGGTIMPASFLRVGGRSANTEASLVTGDPTLQGNWWKVTAAASTGGELWYQNLSGAAVIPGHRYLFRFRFKATGLRNANSGAGATFLAKAVFNGKTDADALYDFRALNTISYDVADGVASVEFTAPADATALQVQFNIGVTTVSSFDISVGQVTVYDLTAMGVV